MPGPHRLSLISTFALIYLGVTTGWAHAQTKSNFDLPAQPLSTALTALALKAGLNIYFDDALVAGLRAPALKAELTPEEALTRLLSGTTLRAVHVNPDTIRVTTSAGDHHADVTPSAPDSATTATGSLRVAYAGLDAVPVSEIAAEAHSESGLQSATTSESDSGRTPIQEVVITGTHIRGIAPAGSSLKVYTREMIDQSGAATLDQFSRQMVENFAGTDSIANQNSNANLAPLSGAYQNAYQGAALNLKGLGQSATLTLLNGHRTASGGADGSFADISLIPLSAVDHVEVLTDGASAIYGADAVAGVVNIVTRKSFSGAETGLRFGSATDGGATDRAASQLLGTSWDTGSAFVTYEYESHGGLDASQRDYIPSQGGPDSLIPKNRRNSVLLSGSQQLDADTNFSSDIIYADRHFDSQYFLNTSFFSESEPSSGSAKQSGITLSLDHGFRNDWHAELTANYSKVNQSLEGLISESFGPGASEETTALSRTGSQIVGVDALLNGPIVSVPGGVIKGAVGSSFLNEQFNSNQIYTTSGIASVSGVPSVQRNVTSLYSELVVPIVGSQNSRTLFRKIDLSAAVRYDKYSDFGSTTNPKLGLSWEPALGVKVRATYGTSFRAPLLSELHASPQLETYPIPDPSDPSGNTDTLVGNGGNASLGAERSRSFTAGFDLKPNRLAGATIGATYFHIKYSDRISTPPASGGILTYLTDPALSAFVQRNPPAAAVQSAFQNPGFLGDFAGQGAAGVTASFDGRFANIASTKQSGVDLNATYTIQTSSGTLTASAAVENLIGNDFQTVPAASYIKLINSFGQPPKWKGRAGILWADRNFSTSVFANYVNGYRNQLAVPNQPIDSWITADLYISYRTGATESLSAMRNLTISMNANNVTNERPPYVSIPVALAGQNPIPFDPTNASPVGRVLSISVMKLW